MLTPAQKRVLDAIERLTKRLGYSPSYRQLAKALKLRAVSTLLPHVRALERLGFIRRTRVHHGLEIMPLHISALLTCDAGHQRVWYESVLCPVCYAMGKVA